ncbi:hypothetical protein [Streptomyces sp. NPDC127084]|uniref:hypothetical protein n=1 Tax=Streptomyces sp. NPDC127084 TaxID=3347133 RepID=UPI00365CCBAB
MAASKTSFPLSDTRLGARGTAVAVVTTATAGVLASAGGTVALAAGLLGVAAIVLGARVRADKAASATGPYILVIVLMLAADTARFNMNYGERLGRAADWAEGPLDGNTWFIAFVVVPVTVMLFGGYLLGRRLPGASTAVWWTALFATADGLVFLTLAPSADWSRPAVSAAGVAATAGQLLAVAVLVQRLLKPKAVEAVEAPRPLTDRQRNLWSVLLVALVAVYGVTFFRQAGSMLPVTVVVGSMVGGMIGWRRTTSRRPADPAYHVPLFLLMLALFYAHVGEEALTHFNQGVAGITGEPWPDGPFTTFIGLFGMVVWVFAAWSLWHGGAFGNFVLWFLIVGMIIGEPTHLVVFPVVKMLQDGGDYSYFSGMYTALFPTVVAVIALRQILRAHRGSKAAALAEAETETDKQKGH